MSRRRLLLLAGTAEARELANRLAKAGFEVIASLAGSTRQPRPMAVTTRIGGFGGQEAQAAYMTDQAFDLVIDATHPFADRISQRSAEICAALSIPYLRYSRPAWAPIPGETWDIVENIHQLSDLIGEKERVFLATGGQSSDIAKALPGRVLFCRRVDDGSEPFPLSGGWITGRPPFTLAAETALLKQLGVGWLVAKNAGGAARAKLDAARALGVKVVMIARPDGPDAETVSTLDEVMAWAEAHQ
ncbi:cobalt-precorrin-6A reductase [Aliiroseovarius crassostreae]|uniref:Cobalt-precorrin-6A reductase n=1 Tax=Aliiroseovarius crassostreae TaxID=154981 RepID=A0A9Q9H9F5_9RHOB|nr:cobalt-precorrin-6A reductase [Aliiroseovarius crassostreae]UWP94122.1 cobalt-precorrin-6A reductase [Aliiroseovarius crassostreae]